ncbi:unnamed protein product [Urochloa humidicola]
MAIDMLRGDLTITVAGLLAASSPDPMQDLRSLWRSCKWMWQVCKSRHVVKSIPVQHVQEHELYAVADYGRDYRNNLIGKLAKAGNVEACFRGGVRVVFDVYRSELVYPLDNLKSAAHKGHNLAAYMLAVCLYRSNGSAVDDEKAKELIRKLEGEDGPGAAATGGGGVRQRWTNNACVVARLRTAALAEMYDPPYIDNWVNIAKPERVFAHNAGGNCGHLPGTEQWVSLWSSAVKTAEFVSSVKLSSTNISCRSV